MLKQNRPNCINLCCAVFDHENGEEMFINSGYTEMLSGIYSAYDPRHLKRIDSENAIMNGQTHRQFVPTRTLSSICKEHNVNHIDYLSIDVEGAEKQVIDSIDFDAVSIHVIGFENNYKDKSDLIIDYLKTKGYELLDYCGLDIMMIKNPPGLNI